MVSSLYQKCLSFRSIQADLGDTAGSVLEHCNKASMVISLLAEGLAYNC